MQMLRTGLICLDEEKRQVRRVLRGKLLSPADDGLKGMDVNQAITYIAQRKGLTGYGYAMDMETGEFIELIPTTKGTDNATESVRQEKI